MNAKGYNIPKAKYSLLVVFNWFGIDIIMLFSAFVNNKKRCVEFSICAQSHIKAMPGCSIIPAHVYYSPKAFANLSVAAFVR